MNASHTVPHAAPVADTTDAQALAWQAGAENALTSALHLIRALDCDDTKLQQAAARVLRAAALIDRLGGALRPH